MSFTWIPIYSEIARRVLDYENRQGDLLTLLGELAHEGLKVISLVDKDASGNPIPLAEIDPFTFFASLTVPTPRRADVKSFQG
jgi:5-methylcytosine-specific restriction protein B